MKTKIAYLVFSRKKGEKVWLYRHIQWEYSRIVSARRHVADTDKMEPHIWCSKIVKRTVIDKVVK